VNFLLLDVGVIFPHLDSNTYSSVWHGPGGVPVFLVAKGMFELELTSVC